MHACDCISHGQTPHWFLFSLHETSDMSKYVLSFSWDLEAALIMTKLAVFSYSATSAVATHTLGPHQNDTLPCKLDHDDHTYYQVQTKIKLCTLRPISLEVLL